MSVSQEKGQLCPQRYGLAFFCILGAILALDQWTKYLVSSQMRVGQTIELPVGFFQLTYVRNFGGAFGMMVDAQVVFVTAALLTIGCVYWQFPNICATTGKWGVTVSAGIVAGAIGNLFDRLRLGYVVDMIDFRWWPVFNVADIGITVGITLLVGWMVWTSKDEASEVLSSSDSNDNSINK